VDTVPLSPHRLALSPVKFLGQGSTAFTNSASLPPSNGAAFQIPKQPNEFPKHTLPIRLPFRALLGRENELAVLLFVC
jgi:hypothetical protein